MDDKAVNGSWVKLMVHWFTNPVGNNTTYLGFGPSWGVTAAGNKNGRVYTGSGIQGEFTAGFEMLRASTIRTFVEFSATLPFYRSEDSGDHRWTPSFVISVGGGYGKPNVVQVVEQ